MPQFDCDIPCIVCAPGPSGTRGLAPLDPNNPFLNLSSEFPDVDNFIGINWTPGDPPLGEFFYAVGCLGMCVGRTQAEADLCAYNQTVFCTGPNWPTGGGGGGPAPDSPNPLPPREVFPNLTQVGIFICEDGTQSTYTVPLGTIYSLNQETANNIALSLANNRARNNAVCLGELSSSRICFDVNTVITLAPQTLPVNALPLVYDIISGAVPDGMSLSQNASTMFISGAPTVGGMFTFTVQATSATGTVVTKTCSIDVFGITNSSPLPECTVGIAYLQALNLDGTPDGIFEFTIDSGALPDGLTINSSTGVISGTSTTVESATFTIKVADDSIQCFREFTMESVDACVGFDCLTWVTIPASPSGGDVWNLNGGNFGILINNPTLLNAVGSMDYTGPLQNCSLIISLISGAPGSGCTLTVTVDAVNVLTWTEADGVGVFPLVLPVSVAAEVLVTMDCNSGPTNFQIGGDIVFDP